MTDATGVLTGRGVLLWLGGFFGLVIAVNVWFIAASVETFRGEDEQKPYLQGVEFNRTLARRAEQKTLGWRASIAAERVAGGRVRVAVALAGADGAPERGLRLAGELRHPADENRDHPLALREVAPGLYQADLGQVAPGRWDVLVHSLENEAPFQASRRLWLR